MAREALRTAWRLLSWTLSMTELLLACLTTGAWLALRSDTAVLLRRSMSESLRLSAMLTFLSATMLCLRPAMLWRLYALTLGLCCAWGSG